MADEREVITSFVVKEEGLKALRQSVEQARLALRQMTSDAKTFDLTGKKAADTTAIFARETAKLKREAQVNDLGKQYGILAQQIGDADKAAKLLLADLIKIGATGDETRRALNNFNVARQRTGPDGLKAATEQQGDISTTLSSISSLVGGNQIAQFGADVSGVLEYLPRFGEALKGLPAQARTVVEAIGVGNIGMIGAIAAAGVAIKLFADKAQADANRARGVIDSIFNANELAANNTTESLNKLREQAQTQLDTASRNFLTANEIFNKLQQDTAEQYGALGLAVTQANAALGTGAGEYKAASDALQAANKSYDDAVNAVNAVDNALRNEQVARNDSLEATRKAAEAEDALAAARARNAVKGIDAAINAQLEASNLAASANPEAIQNRIESLGRERKAILDNLAALQAQVDAAEQGSEAQKVLQESLTGYRDRLMQIDTSLMTLATSGTLAVATSAKEATDALKAQADMERELVSATERYNNDVKRIEEQSLQARASAQDKFNQALVQAAEAAATAAENALQKLQQKRDDLARELSQEGADAYKEAQLERLDAELNFQRDEAKAARDHARNLQQIREDAQANEEELLLRGDFAALFSARRQTTRDINRANADYVAQRQEQNIAFRAQLTDQITQYQRERENRLIKFQRDLEETQIQYNRERQQAEANRRLAITRAGQQYQQELTLANQKYVAELNARRQAIQQELKLITEGEKAKAQIFQAVLNQARAILAAMSGGGSGGSGGSGRGPTFSRAFGGGLLAGQKALVNDGFPGQRESFNGVNFPPGLGMFIPAMAGNVNPGSAGMPPVNITQHITGGADATLIADISAKQIEYVVTRIFKRGG